MGKKVVKPSGTARGGRQRGVLIAIVLLAASNLALGAWLYLTQGERLPLGEQLAGLWRGVAPLFGGVRGFAGTAMGWATGN
ncbi:hypothetical protein [Caldimonas tepidiphila]|uniref:hypothetical protein n=1 Tax=Caldimonas tepidiphila TaxID=2315841 RepID=UPI000E5B5C48|nr:hypothetical protein [Caldimonas tepidiphila]